MADQQDRNAHLENRFLPRGAATSVLDCSGPVRTFYFALLPKLTMLALSSAVEPLRVANQLSRQELYNWYTMTPDGGEVECSNGIKLVPDMKLEPVPRDSIAIVCAGIEPHQTLSKATTSWVRHQRRLGSVVGGVCTGSFTLAEAGLLTDKRFTVHWENLDSFIETYENDTPTMRRYEIDDYIMTSAGGSAAVDLMLQVIENDHGYNFAMTVSDMCLHGHGAGARATQRSSQSVMLETRNPVLIEAVELMQKNLEDPLTLDILAENVGVSRRQLERYFKNYLGHSPKKYYSDLRLGRAYALLGETNMSVAEIAAATGFNSATNLSKLFRRRYGVSPTKFKGGWARNIDEQSNEAGRGEYEV